MEQISPKEAKRLIDDEGARLIDVRERGEWDEMRIPGAELVPLSGYEDNPDQIDPAPLTIFQCARGVRSETAIAIYLEKHPGERALNLEGGIGAWAERGLPIEIGPAT